MREFVEYRERMMMIMAYDCDSQSQCNQLQQRQRSEYLMILFFSISLGLFFFSFCCLFFALYRSIDLLLIFLSTYARVCVHTDFLSYYAYRKNNIVRAQTASSV